MRVSNNRASKYHFHRVRPAACFSKLNSAGAHPKKEASSPFVEIEFCMERLPHTASPRDWSEHCYEHNEYTRNDPVTEPGACIWPVRL